MGGREIFTALFVFFICFVVFGAFVYAMWYDIRTRIWFKNFDRDTKNAIAEVFSHDENEEDGTITVQYRFEDENGKKYSGAQAVMKSAMTPRMAIGAKLRVNYHKHFPNTFSFIEGYETNFKRASRNLEFIVGGAFLLWWFLS